MQGDKYLKMQVGDYEIQTTDPRELPIAITYSLEDEQDFQKKQSARALDIEVPASVENSKGANTFHNPSVEDLSSGELFKNFQPARITAAGQELLIGKGILKNATHTNVPVSYTWNIFGDNADWIIDLKETTLYEILKHINFVLSKANIEASWVFDGTNENLPYVFAPVRYREPFDGYELINNVRKAKDENIPPIYMKPSLSKYFILYWGFKLAGYKISSGFFNTNYYRRMTMPWTWGNFLNSEGTRLDVHKFLSKSSQDAYFNAPNGGSDFIWDLKVTNDSTDGAFDNNDDYSWNPATKEMVWNYKTPHFGVLEATFSATIFYSLHATGNSDVDLYIQWYKNGVRFNGTNGDVHAYGNLVASKSASGLGGTEAGSRDMFATTIINPNDIITVKFHLHTFESKVGTASARANVLQFKLDYFNIPLSGTIDFENYTGLKNYKFLDFLSGEVDNYDLSFKTDPLSKTVYIEPTHAYSLNNDLSVMHPGFFVDDMIDWDGKCDYSKQWVMELYDDGSREQMIKFKDDNNDGTLKLVQDRNSILLGASKYVLPERFKSGKEERENRFFGATMHYDVDQFAKLGTGTNTGIAPQMIAMVPENIANTSNSESANTFLPKSAWYKGLVTGVGAWKWDGNVRQDYPFMFAVNYKDGGENDPILSYSDERISNGAGFVIGKGLFKRFYWQRYAIMRNGQWYTAYLRLLNNDVAGKMHREFKKLKGQKWELIKISNYRPLVEEATQCQLRKWVPVIQKDVEATFPSAESVLEQPLTNPSDIKYNQLKCLKSDIPL